MKLAVGFFDGVHLGHRTILEGCAKAVTFARHPLAVLAPDRAPRLLMGLDDRVAAIRACGVGEVTVLDFTAETAAMPPEAFAGLLRREAGGGEPTVRCGADWRFGRGGRGDAAFLRRLGFAVEVADDVHWGGGRISSSRIRACLARGEVGAAAAMQGRPCAVRGRTARGKGRGRELGFPTVNLVPCADGPELPLGVYAVKAGGAPAVANFGLAPTMGAAAWTSPVWEVHFLDAADGVPTFDRIELGCFLRGERRFASVDGLRRQMAADRASAHGFWYNTATCV